VISIALLDLDGALSLEAQGNPGEMSGLGRLPNKYEKGGSQWQSRTYSIIRRIALA
jgi:hypothetical protein